MSDLEIIAAIEKYARAYAELQRLQDTVDSLPPGDQKTGCIGEYYAYRYLSHRHPDARLTYGSHSEKGWDIAIASGRTETKIQVKTVSAFSRTRTISPIHRGWQELLVIYLNRAFYPEGFWIIADVEIFRSSSKLESRKCPDPINPKTGSRDIPFGTNRVGELLEALNA